MTRRPACRRRERPLRLHRSGAGGVMIRRMDLQFDWEAIGSHSLKLAFAYVLALPIAYDREKEARSAGLRTFPLVAVSSCAFLLMAATLFRDNPEAQARALQGLMTGIGFIGGGAILKKGLSVHGLATAVSIWSVAASSAAVALGIFEISVIISLINFATLRLLKPVKKMIGAREQEGEDITESDS